MSIPVALDDLAEQLAAYPWGYLVTIGEDAAGRARPHLRAVATTFADGRFTVRVGSRTRENLAAQPVVTMVFPPAELGGHTLIVDGEGTPGPAAEDDPVAGDIVVVPVHAVLHRFPTLPDGAGR